MWVICMKLITKFILPFSFIETWILETAETRNCNISTSMHDRYQNFSGNAQKRVILTEIKAKDVGWCQF